MQTYAPFSSDDYVNIKFNFSMIKLVSCTVYQFMKVATSKYGKYYS